MQISTIFRASIFMATLLCVAYTQSETDRIKPYGLRRTFEHGLGDRYYTGVPAYAYQHMWPEWKREIWYTIGDWSHEEAPEWIIYYDYPFAVWPNSYRYFGSPYYTRDQNTKRRLAKIPPKKKYRFTENSASF